MIFISCLVAELFVQPARVLDLDYALHRRDRLGLCAEAVVEIVLPLENRREEE